MAKDETKKLKEIMILAGEEAKRLGNSKISPEHLFLGILRLKQAWAIDVLIALGIDFYEVRNKIERKLNKQRDKNEEIPETLDYTLAANSILRRVAEEAWKLGDEEVESEHLMLAMLRNQAGFVTKLFNTMGVDYDRFKEQLLKEKTRMQSDFGEEADEEEDGGEEDAMYNPYRQGGAIKSDTPVLDNFGIDITKAAEAGSLDPIVGRDREIERLAQILSRRKKNNPVLIGEPGVGKSAIAEGLAIRIVQKKVSRVLFDKRVIALDIASIVAGTKYRGQFEERMKAILNELAKNKNIILFIDEIHTIVGAGGSGGSLDAANMLKPALSRGEIQCIGATTLDEYRQNIEKDGALERRFQKVLVEPTTFDETVEILNNIKSRYEDHHNVRYTDAAIKACVQLTTRYISDRALPDKAIDAMDEAGSRVHITNIVVPPVIEELEKEIEGIKGKKKEAVKQQNFEVAAAFRDQERQLLAQLEQEKDKWQKDLQENRVVVDEEGVAEVVAMMTGVPVKRIAKTEGMKLLQMREELSDSVIGQQEAIEKIVKAIHRNRAGLKDPNRPIGSFIFLGPTGVGKTQLAKVLSQYLFDTPDSLIRIDMSEYMEKHSVARLIGAPPGYVGYDEGGQLTEAVRRKPYCVVLFDEVEKAHPDVFNVLLQVLDDGRITDSTGKTVDFKNTIIIMTSNIGSQYLLEGIDGQGNITKDAENMAMGDLRAHFRPEFLNRLDEIILFKPLTKDNIRNIVALMIEDTNKRLADREIKVELTEAAKHFVVEHGYDPIYGARPLKRYLQKYVETLAAKIILQDQVRAGDVIVIDNSLDGLTAYVETGDRG